MWFCLRTTFERIWRDEVTTAAQVSSADDSSARTVKRRHAATRRGESSGRRRIIGAAVCALVDLHSHDSRRTVATHPRMRHTSNDVLRQAILQHQFLRPRSRTAPLRIALSCPAFPSRRTAPRECWLPCTPDRAQYEWRWVQDSHIPIQGAPCSRTFYL